jgi:lysophospholipase L1-like esterase
LRKLCKVLLLAVSIVLAAPLVTSAGEPKRIMVFGDSNTWGWIARPEQPPTTRFPGDIRWPGVLQAELGEGYHVIEEALSGRTTNITPSPDPLQIDGAGLNGAAYLPAALGSHMPLDLVIIMLGINDLWADKNRTPLEIGLAAMELVARVKGSAGAAGTSYPAPDVLLIAPPPVAPSVKKGSLAEYLGESVEASMELGAVYGRLATAVGIAFLDAGEVVTVSGVDGVHFSEDNHRALGQAVAAHVKEMLGEEMLPAAQ